MKSKPDAVLQTKRLKIEKAISLEDRFMAGVVSALAMAVMALGLPLLLIFVHGGRVSGGQAVLDLLSTFNFWGVAVIGTAGVAGFTLGPDRVIDVFGHLWGTQRPHRPLLSVLMWTTLIGIAYVSYKLQIGF
jgi:hypothetical protein